MTSRTLVDRGPDEGLDSQEVFLAVCSYVPVLCLLPTLSRSDSEFARAHGRQGTVLFLAEIVACMAAFIPQVGVGLMALALLALTGAAALAARMALAHRTWKIPLIGTMADRLRTLAP
ncbi:MAG: hypothetical protein HY303_03170 [Candidatus Wallbacteria bacterium]|nr:hypothetical protein [Candidatus Wallbacteria bacterium]